MVSIAAISSALNDPDPDLETIIKYIEEQAKPVAVEKEPLKVIAPAVSHLHSRARTLGFELTAKGMDLTRLKNAVIRGMDEILDMYQILSGIAPPTGDAQAIEFDKEIKFARKQLGIVYRIFKAMGGKADADWEGVMLSVPDREKYSAELKVLRANYPEPGFASIGQMVKQGERAAIWGWIFIILWILFETGIIQGLFNILE